MGKLLTHRCLPTELFKGKAHLLQVVHEELKLQLAQFPGIAAIGVAHSGVIDSRAGTVLFWPMVEGWNDAPLRQIIEEAHGLPTFLEECVNAMAVAEQRLGHWKGVRNLLLVNVGWGIGSALFLDGHLYGGRDGMAGEFEHTTIEENGSLCTCGNRGCLERYSSASAIVGRARAELQQGVGSSLLHEVGENLDRLSVEAISAAKSYDRLSERVLSEVAVHLGTAMASTVNFLNPEKIVLGGKVPEVAGELFLTALLQSLRQRALPHAMKEMTVVISQIGEEAAALGMVFIAGEHVLRARCREIKGESRLGGGRLDPSRQRAESGEPSAMFPQPSLPAGPAKPWSKER